MQTSSILRVGAYVCVRVFMCEQHKITVSINTARVAFDRSLAIKQPILYVDTLWIRAGELVATRNKNLVVFSNNCFL